MAGEAVELQITEPPDPVLDELASTHPTYAALCRQAKILKSTTGLHDIEAMDVVRLAGPDKQGRPVFLFNPANLSRGVDLDRVTMFCLTLMHELVVVQGKGYGCVWLCNNLSDSQLGFLFFRRTYKMLPRAYRKNMLWLRIVHPAVQVRLILFGLSYLLADSFWDKFDYVDRIEFLDEVVDIPSLRIPKEYFDYDRMLDEEARHLADPSNPHGIVNESIIGGMMGGGTGGMMGGAWARAWTAWARAQRRERRGVRLRRQERQERRPALARRSGPRTRRRRTRRRRSSASRRWW